MSPKEFEALKSKIQKDKDLKTKAEGALEQIMEQLSKEGFATIEEAKAAVASLKEGITHDEYRRELLLEELKKVTNWEEI